MVVTIGVVGGGQLCLMLAQAAITLKCRLIAIDPTPNCPAFPYLHEQIIGDFKDESLIRLLADKSDIITFEIELASSKVLQELEKAGKQVYPSPGVLQIIQDKFIQAQYLKKNNISVADVMPVENISEVKKAVEKFGLPLMFKARIDSYDGRGNYVLKSQSDIPKIFDYFNNRKIMAQKFIPFEKEISVICTRSKQGETKCFPVAENIHGIEYNILKTTIAPARINKSVNKKAISIAARVMAAFQTVGTFGIEMFVVNDEVLVNEIAPRVHNSGHFTIEACKSSQFELHLRAITGAELKSTDMVCDSAVMMNIIGKSSGNYKMHFGDKVIKGTKEIEKDVYIHNYGKHVEKPYRKMGHLTVLAKKGESVDKLIKRANELFNKIK